MIKLELGKRKSELKIRSTVARALITAVCTSSWKMPLSVNLVPFHFEARNSFWEAGKPQIDFIIADHSHKKHSKNWPLIMSFIEGPCCIGYNG